MKKMRGMFVLVLVGIAVGVLLARGTETIGALDRLVFQKVLATGGDILHFEDSNVAATNAILYGPVNVQGALNPDDSPGTGGGSLTVHGNPSAPGTISFEGAASGLNFNDMGLNTYSDGGAEIWYSGGSDVIGLALAQSIWVSANTPSMKVLGRASTGCVEDLTPTGGILLGECTTESGANFSGANVAARGGDGNIASGLHCDTNGEISLQSSSGGQQSSSINIDNNGNIIFRLVSPSSSSTNSSNSAQSAARTQSASQSPPSQGSSSSLIGKSLPGIDLSVLAR